MNYPEIVKILVGKNANVNVRNKDGENAVMIGTYLMF